MGDFLDLAGNRPGQLTIADCAAFLAKLPVKHLVFTRGNHEGRNWREFVRAWPMQRCALTALYGSAFTLGPLVMLGFPCRMGASKPWADSMPKEGNQLTHDPAKTGRKRLRSFPGSGCPLNPPITPSWPEFLANARTTDLVPISRRQAIDPGWGKAVDRYQPLLTVSGHDHETPFLNHAWWGRFDATFCINVGQAADELAYTVLDFHFDKGVPALPARIKVRAFPWDESLEIVSGRDTRGGLVQSPSNSNGVVVRPSKMKAF